MENIARRRLNMINISPVSARKSLLILYKYELLEKNSRNSKVDINLSRRTRNTLDELIFKNNARTLPFVAQFKKLVL